MSLETIFTILASLGVGGLLGTIFQSYLQNKSKIGEKNFNLKEKRYKAIMILMWTCLDPENQFSHLRYYREDIKNVGMLVDELRLELFNMLLFAGDGVIDAFLSFINKPTYRKYSKVAIEMRKDLYGKKTKLHLLDLKTIK